MKEYSFATRGGGTILEGTTPAIKKCDDIEVAKMHARKYLTDMKADIVMIFEVKRHPKDEIEFKLVSWVP